MENQQEETKGIQIPQFITKSKQNVEQSQFEENMDFQDKSKFSKELKSIKNTQSCEIFKVQQSNVNQELKDNQNQIQNKKKKPKFKISHPNKYQDKEINDILESQSPKFTILNQCETKQSAFCPKLNRNQDLQNSQQNVEYYASKLKVVQDQKVLNEAKQFLFKKKRVINFYQLFDLRRLCKKKQIDEVYYEEQKIAKKGIEKEVSKSMQILELYKDLIFLKKSVMVLLKKDQIAALQLVGYSQNKLIQHGKNCYIGSNQLQNNFFEDRFELLNSKDLQSEYIKKFIKKCQSSQNLNQIDQRIFSSIQRSADQ
ncbi:hypothetical protein ABPG74_019758 [Tetrahymena malaccensis]